MSCPNITGVCVDCGCLAVYGVCFAGLRVFIRCWKLWMVWLRGRKSGLAEMLREVVDSCDRESQLSKSLFMMASVHAWLG